VSVSERLNASAKRLIEREGRDIVFIKYSDLPADPNNPHLGGNAIDDETTQKAVVVAFTQEETLRSGKDLRGYKKLITAHYDTNLEDFHLAVDGEKSWKIKHVEPSQPGETIILYEMMITI